MVIELSFLHKFCQYLCRENESVHYCETYFVTRMCMIRIRIYLSVEIMPYHMIAIYAVMIFSSWCFIFLKFTESLINSY